MLIAYVVFGTLPQVWCWTHCAALRLAMRRAATAGLNFYTVATPTGSARATDAALRQSIALEALANTTVLLAKVEAEGGFSQCLPSDPLHKASAEIALALLRLLLQHHPSSARDALASAQFVGQDVPSLLSRRLSWSQVVHSGWPVFHLAALVEHEIRHPKSETLSMSRIYAQDPSENCSDDQEVFREIGVLYAGEGRTVRINDIRDFLRRSLDGDQAADAGPRFMLDILYSDPLERGRCPAALAVAFAALADSLQCHWHRPRSQYTHEMADAVLERAQAFAVEAFGGKGQNMQDEERNDDLPVAPLFTSRWPILGFLARLDPPPPEHGSSSIALQAAPTVAIVSWSSREAELGGLNWAAKFVEEVFGGLPGVELKEDVECADIFVFRSKVPSNYGGVLIFVDGETRPEDSNYRELLAGYPASIVAGPFPAGGRSLFFPLPYAASSFASRADFDPNALTLTWSERRAILNKRGVPVQQPDHEGFAAYLAFRCWPHRERFFQLLDAAAATHGLGSVDALSRCGHSGASEAQRRSARYSTTYMDDATALYAGYRFAIVFENRISPRYVTEKIVNAYLSGAIPIYWGSPFVLKIFNPYSFIYVNAFVSFEAAVQHIVEVAQDPQQYASFRDAPPLRNTSDSRWFFSWHRSSPPLQDGKPTLREELAGAALAQHRSALGSSMPAIERRPWDYLSLFT